MVLSQQNYHASMYNVIYERMFSCNHFGVPTFTLHLKILFKNFSQQYAGYHLVLYRSNMSERSVSVTKSSFL
jgi:hypothetical protein